MGKPRLGQRQRLAKRRQAEALHTEALERKLAVEALAFQNRPATFKGEILRTTRVRDCSSKLDRAYPQSGTQGGGADASSHERQQVLSRSVGKVNKGGAIMSKPLYPTAKRSKAHAQDGWTERKVDDALTYGKL